MAGDKHALPPGQVGIGLPPLARHFLFQALDLVGQGVQVLGHRIVSHFLYALLELVDRFFKFQDRAVLFHGVLRALKSSLHKR